MAYVILLNTIVEFSASRIIVAADETSFVKSYIRVLNNGTLFVLNQHSTSGVSPVVVKLWSLDLSQNDVTASTSLMGVSQYVIDG